MKNQSRKSRLGGGATEYIIIIVILAIVIGVAVVVFRDKVRTKVQQSGDSAATTNAEPVK